MGTGHCADDIIRIVEIENKNFNAVIHTKRRRRAVHNVQSLLQNVHMRKGIEFLGVGIELGIAVVNSVNIRCLEYNVGSDLGSPQCRCGIG